MKTAKLLLSGVLALCITAACNDDDDDNMNSMDRTFMEQAAYGNLAEIGAGQLASTKATNASVKMFGQMMVSDHSTAQTELEGLASGRGVDLPDQPDPPHQALMQRLMTLQGLAFDTAYMNSQVMDHQNTVALFEQEISNGRDPQIIQYANKYLPHIRMHLQKADSLARALR
jgi:putative membrane protein